MEYINVEGKDVWWELADKKLKLDRLTFEKNRMHV